jgi:hypothetical protein
LLQSTKPPFSTLAPFALLQGVRASLRQADRGGKGLVIARLAGGRACGAGHRS